MAEICKLSTNEKNVKGIYFKILHDFRLKTVKYSYIYKYNLRGYRAEINTKISTGN
jgi:hypothetical protein